MATDEHSLTPEVKKEDKEERESLAARVDRFRREVEEVVTKLGEHPLYELKRQCDFSNLAEKMEFVKDVQAIATSRISSEKFVVIGADERNRAFVPVKNVRDFEETKIRDLLEKYLDPAPQFEVFNLNSSGDFPFILIVISRQRTRRILARCTVEHVDGQKGKLILREGDLWTKSDSSGKRLARPEDWDDIYEEKIELATEARARQRIDHTIQHVVAQERLRAASGPQGAAVPVHFSDLEFQHFMEQICIGNNRARLNVLLEHLRDDLLESWASVYDEETEDIRFARIDVEDLRKKAKLHRDSVFVPALQRLTAAGLFIVKYGGIVDLFASVMALLLEVHRGSDHQRWMLHISLRELRSKHSVDHIGHTIFPLAALESTWMLGAYITKRQRFQYMEPLIHQIGDGSLLDGTTWKSPLAMWPFPVGWGEPQQLGSHAGRIELVEAKISADPLMARLIGGRARAHEALMKFELLVEFSSYLANGTGTPQQVKERLKRKYPDISLRFRPSLIAFDLFPIAQLAEEIADQLNAGNPEPLTSALFDTGGADTASMRTAFLSCLRDLAEDHGKFCLSQQRFPSLPPWSESLMSQIRRLPKGSI